MKTLYEPSFEHDNCGIGAVVNIDGSKSHKIVDNALSIVEKLEHRAGKDASGETGDGVGILVQISHDFFSKNAADLLGNLGEREYGIGQFFFPSDGGAENEKKRFEQCCSSEGLKFLGWRKVPVNAKVLGKKARDCMPEIWQGFVAKPESCKIGIDFDRRLYIVRRNFEKVARGGVAGDAPAEGVAENRGAGCSEGETSPSWPFDRLRDRRLPRYMYNLPRLTSVGWTYDSSLFHFFYKAGCTVVSNLKATLNITCTCFS